MSEDRERVRLLGYASADHWAVASALGRSRPFVASIFAEKNPFPREVLLEAILRHFEEQFLDSEAR